MLRVIADMLAGLDDRIVDLDNEIAKRAREDKVARRLMTIPSSAQSLPPRSSRSVHRSRPSPEAVIFSAWLGLAPLQHSTGGKQTLGRISKMGKRTIRRLLIIGGSSIVRQASMRGAPAGSWLERMLARKPRILVSVALANKMALIAWLVMTRNEDCRAPPVVAA